MPALRLRTTSLIVSIPLLALGMWQQKLPLAWGQTVPAGFQAELIYRAPDIEHPSVVTCDDEGNLFVGEDPMDMRGPTTKEFDRVVLIRWDAATGHPQKTVFCEGLSAVFGLIWHDGALYVMHAPHYSVFRDTNGDGVADERRDLAEGFGPAAGVYGFNDHIVTGTRLGLDGRVYVSVGDKGIQRATGSDGSSISLEGGGVVSMRLDGSQLEVVSSGTRNHLDVAMDSFDNIFTYDNTDDGLGWWTRFTHHVPTGYYGYPYDYLKHPERHLPRISEHGGGSPVGAACYREAAWPAEYRDNAFHCEWGKQKIQRFVTQRDGATFRATMEDFMVADGKEEFRPLDLCFSPDGQSMYVADWNFGAWCNPRVCGRLFRVRYVGGGVAAEPPRVASNACIAEQLRALAHPAHSERMRAQWKLASLGQPAIKPVADVITAKAPPLAKIHALWTLHALADRVAGYDPTPSWIKALGEQDEQVRAQAARAIGERRSKTGVAPLIAALGDPQPVVRMWSAIGLGRIGDPAAAAPLYRALGEQDAFARFTIVQALRALGDWGPAKKYLASGDPGTRQATLLALTGVYDPAAVEALAWAATTADDEQTRTAAIVALGEVHRRADAYEKGWWGTQPARGLPARPKQHAWSGTEAVLTTLRQAARSNQENVRRTAVQTLVAIKDAGALPLFAAAAMDQSNPTQLRTEAVGALVALNAAGSSEVLGRLCVDSSTPEELLVAVLDGIGTLEAKSLAPAIEQWLGHSSPVVRGAALDNDARLLGPAAAKNIAAALADADPAVRRVAVRWAGDLKLRELVPQIVALGGDAHLRDAVIGALAAMPDRLGLNILLDGLVDKNPTQRQLARGALVKLRREIGPDIIALAQHDELPPAVRVELQPVFNAPEPITHWQVVGNWMQDEPPAFDAAQIPDTSRPILIGGKSYAWQSVSSEQPPGRTSLSGRFASDNNTWALAYATIEAREAGMCSFQIGCDDEALLWINGQPLYQFRGSRSWGPDSGSGQVALRQGTNHVWLMTGNHGGPWEFSLAIGRSLPEFAFLYENVPAKLDARAFADFATTHPGDANRGREIFADLRGVGCAKCHTVKAQGGKIGPDLTGVGAKYPREELIRSVLEPSNRVASGYQVTTIVTTGGKVYAGILRSDAQDAVELLDAEGRVTRIPTDEIDERNTSTLSLMPNGLKDGLTLENFADVIAYLESLK